jgi:hypothetical protein
MPGDKDWDAVLAGWQERRDAMYEAKGITKAKNSQKTPECIYTKWELLEYSDVAVPSNPQATAIAISKGLITEKQVIAMTKEEVLKPFANEHACRLENPDDFDKFNRVNCDQKSDGKCIDVIYGIKAGKSKIQALRYPKDVWDDDAAESHCKGRGGTFEEASEERSFSGSPAIGLKSAESNEDAVPDLSDFDMAKGHDEIAGLHGETVTFNLRGGGTLSEDDIIQEADEVIEPDAADEDMIMVRNDDLELIKGALEAIDRLLGDAADEKVLDSEAEMLHNIENDNDLEITPEMAKLLLELDAQEDDSDDDEETPSKTIQYMLGKFV